MARCVDQPLDPGLLRVLVLANDHHMGNTVLTLPIIEAFARHFDNGTDLLIDRRYAALPAMLGAAGRIRVIPYDGKASSGSATSRYLAGGRQLAWLTRRRYHAVIDTVGSIRSTTICAASLSARRIGLSTGRRTRVYSRVIDAEVDTHYGRRYSKLLRAIGVDAEALPATLSASSDDHAAVRAGLSALLPGCAGPIAVFHPMAGHPLRCWPTDRFAAVADGLVERLDARVVVIGAPGDRPTADRMFASMRHAGSASFLTLGLSQLVALFERAAVLVSNESGPTHLAAATQVPIVTIFGPTKEHQWRPMRDTGLTVLRGAACDPRCRKRGCVASSRCLKRLTVSTVLDEALAAVAHPVPIVPARIGVLGPVLAAG